MKFLTISSLLLTVLVASVTAQQQMCGGSIWSANCHERLDLGYRGPGCPRTLIMWWYDRGTRSCRLMTYMGCGGNGNRWCSRPDCERRCHR